MIDDAGVQMPSGIKEPKTRILGNLWGEREPVGTIPKGTASPRPTTVPIGYLLDHDDKIYRMTEEGWKELVKRKPAFLSRVKAVVGSWKAKVGL